MWAIKALPPAMWVRTPTRELALLRIPLARFYGDKIVFAAPRAGDPAAAGVLLRAIGLGLPVAIPAIASLGLAAVMFFLPNYNAVDDAKKARLEFARALGRLHRPRRPGAQQRLRRTPGDGVGRRGRRLVGLHPTLARN